MRDPIAAARPVARITISDFKTRLERNLLTTVWDERDECWQEGEFYRQQESRF